MQLLKRLDEKLRSITGGNVHQSTHHSQAQFGALAASDKKPAERPFEVCATRPMAQIFLCSTRQTDGEDESTDAVQEIEIVFGNERVKHWTAMEPQPRCRDSQDPPGIWSILLKSCIFISPKSTRIKIFRKSWEMPRNYLPKRAAKTILAPKKMNKRVKFFKSVLVNLDMDFQVGVATFLILIFIPFLSA
jgi:hypothetical protein